jgi:hypothetical protein
VSSLEFCRDTCRVQGRWGGRRLGAALVAQSALLSRITVGTAGLAVALTPAHARSDSQVWLGSAASVNLSPKWKISQEEIVRLSDKRGGLYDIEAITSVAYKLSPSIWFAAGYVHNPTYLSGNLVDMERRAREQITFENVVRPAGGSLSVRARFEQRWRDEVAGVAWRARPYFKYSHPLVGKTSLALSSEVFINLKRAPFQRTNGFDRVRNQMAVTAPLFKKFTFETGYLNQYGFVKGGADNVDHVVSASLSLSL